MASEQKRWLTNPKGKLAKADLLAVLCKEEAWALLPAATRQQLYAMLPPPQNGEPAHDIEVHPFSTELEPYIKEEVDQWQRDLQDGREVKTWRERAMQAGKDRSEGKWDEWKQQQRELDWGQPIKKSTMMKKTGESHDTIEEDSGSLKPVECNNPTEMDQGH